MTESVSYFNTNTKEEATKNSSKSLILVISRHLSLHTLLKT